MELETVRTRARAALRNLEAHRSRINGLNVYPVPDGDTGTNLTLTLRSIVEALEESRATGAAAVASELSRAALMGARGNSGVILSQIVRGAASVLGEQDEVDGQLIARALRGASDEAYRATLRPVEGTMLTVIREMAEEAERPEVAVLPKAELLAAVVARGEDTVTRTPSMLPKLQEAGVVDAGGAGLVEILRGIQLSVAGLPLPEPVEDEDQAPPLDHEFSEFKFCTNFVIEGEALDREAVSRDLSPLGDSLHVVGDRGLLRVHVHTDDPDAAVAVARHHGAVLESTFDAADMHVQIREQLEKTGELLTAVVAVAPGDGNRRTFERVFGEVVVVGGGQTANPSVQDLVDAVEETLAPEVVLLPNNGNVVGAALEAAEAVAKPVLVVPTRTVQEGIYLVNETYHHELPAAANASAMAEAREHVRSGEVTRAVRSVVQDGVSVREGAWLGLVDDRAVAAGDDFDEVAVAVARELLSEGEDALTLILGQAVPPLEALQSRIREVASGVTGFELEQKDGGQEHYPLLLFSVRAWSERAQPARATAGPTLTAAAVAERRAADTGLLRVVLVEDSEPFRVTFREVFDGRFGLAVAGVAPDGESALATIAELQPDVVAVDARLPGMSGADLVRRLHASQPGRPVVCLTAEPSGTAVDEVMSAGAMGVVAKTASNEELARALLAAAGRTLLTQQNTAIVLDSTSDYREDVARARYPNVRVVPLGITFETDAGEQSYLDHRDLNGHDFYEMLRRWPARTNAPAPGDYAVVYDELLASYERIYSLHISSKLSATFANAQGQALESAPDRIVVVDAETASLAVVLLAQAVERRLARGTTDEELARLIERFKETNRVVFTVGTLAYLLRGGRISKTQARMGTLLSVKPILSVEDGAIHPIGRVRGRAKALAEFARVFRESTGDSPRLRIAIAHADAPEWVDDIRSLVAAERPHADPEILVAELGAAVGTHAGPGSVGFFWFED